MWLTERLAVVHRENLTEPVRFSCLRCGNLLSRPTRPVSRVSAVVGTCTDMNGQCRWAAFRWPKSPPWRRWGYSKPVLDRMAVFFDSESTEDHHFLDFRGFALCSFVPSCIISLSYSPREPSSLLAPFNNADGCGVARGRSWCDPFWRMVSMARRNIISCKGGSRSFRSCANLV